MNVNEQKWIRLEQTLIHQPPYTKPAFLNVCWLQTTTTSCELLFDEKEMNEIKKMRIFQSSFKKYSTLRFNNSYDYYLFLIFLNSGFDFGGSLSPKQNFLCCHPLIV